MIDLDEVKVWLRVDHDEDDVYIQRLIVAAKQYLKNATGKEFTSDNELARLFCLFLITDWYENRKLAREKVGEQTREIIQSMLNQLKYAEVNENEVQSDPDV